MLCYVMLCYVMLCYVMLCYVMLCYVMFFQDRRDMKLSDCQTLVCLINEELVEIVSFNAVFTAHTDFKSNFWE